MRPAKLGLIYAVMCSKVQSIAENMQKKVQKYAVVTGCVPRQIAGT